MSDDIISYSSDEKDLISGSSDDQDLISGEPLQEDKDPEILSLRPEKLSDYVGQIEVVETLKIAIEASMQRREPIDHVLLHGPPGLGKTTLATLLPTRWGVILTLPPVRPSIKVET